MSKSDHTYSLKEFVEAIKAKNELVAKEFLNQEPKIQELELLNNSLSGDGSLSEDGAIFLCSLLNGSKVSYIEFFNQQIGDAGAIAFAKMLEINPTITKVGLGLNQIGDKAIKVLAKILETNSNVTELNLSANQIGNYDLSPTEHTSLRWTHARDMQ